MMTLTKNDFRMILIAYLLVTIWSAVQDLVVLSVRVEAVVGFAREQGLMFDDPRMGTLMVIGAVLMIAHLASLFGLWFFKGWARMLFPASLLFGLALTTLLGVSIMSAESLIATRIAAIGFGVIVALSFFSPLAAHFPAMADDSTDGAVSAPTSPHSDES